MLLKLVQQVVVVVPIDPTVPLKFCECERDRMFRTSALEPGEAIQSEKYFDLCSVEGWQPTATGQAVGRYSGAFPRSRTLGKGTFLTDADISKKRMLAGIGPVAARLLQAADYLVDFTYPQRWCHAGIQVP